jgi:RNA polymerase sigma factor (TIGR02999 family)
VTRILEALSRGEQQATGELLPLVFNEPRRLAARQLACETPGQTLQARALVHEAYLRLVGGDADRIWNGRAHFLAAAAEAMRRILVEAARRKARKKWGAGARRGDLVDPSVPDSDDDLLALNRLAEEDPVAAKVVELHQFARLGHEEASTALGITVYASRQKWTYARAWLRNALDK